MGALMPPRERQCWRQFRASPGEFSNWILVGTIFGLTIGWGAWGFHTGWQSSVAATEPVVVASPVVDYRPDGGISLKARYLVPVMEGCTRQISYLMYRPIENSVPPEAEFINLGMALGGFAIKNTSAAFTSHLYVPPDTPSGDWNYTMRTYYTCRPIGLVHRSFSTPPFTIRVP